MKEKEEFKTINKELIRLILKNKVKLWLRFIWCIMTSILNVKPDAQHCWPVRTKINNKIPALP
jgi:hypothetical protein